jgi:hypothetical protein
MSTCYHCVDQGQSAGRDDIAGISLLYPAGNYLSTVGSISGKVSMNGKA